MNRKKAIEVNTVIEMHNKGVIVDKYPCARPNIILGAALVLHDSASYVMFELD